MAEVWMSLHREYCVPRLFGWISIWLVADHTYLDPDDLEVHDVIMLDK